MIRRASPGRLKAMVRHYLAAGNTTDRAALLWRMVGRMRTDDRIRFTEIAEQHEWGAVNKVMETLIRSTPAASGPVSK